MPPVRRAGTAPLGRGWSSGPAVDLARAYRDFLVANGGTAEPVALTENSTHSVVIDLDDATAPA